MLFRRTDKYGYSRYYGNGGPALAVKIIISILAVVVIVLGAATLGLQKYMVYTENGGHLELPWHNNNPNELVPVSDTSEVPGEGEENNGADASLPAADASTPDADDIVDDSVPVSNDVEPLVGDLLIQHVSIGDVTRGHAAGTLTDAKANGIMLFMKESGGALNYHSQLAMSSTLNASSASDKSKTIANTIDSLNDDDYYTLAYLNCFDDAKLSAQDGFALKTSGGKTFTASNGVGWADPSSEEAQAYLVGVVSDMADMGFDEVVLYDACYPYGNGADNVNLNGADAEEVITAFYAQLADVAKEKGVMVSVVADPAVILGNESTSGQTLESLKSLGGHVWVMADEADDLVKLSDALNEAGFPENALGVVADQLESGTGYNYLNQD